MANVGRFKILSKPSFKGGSFLVELEDVTRKRKSIIKGRDEKQIMMRLNQFLRS